jgi:hypothetical protein
LYFKPRDKAVILSEALRRSIANSGLYGAESKDLGDARWQMLLGAFRLQTNTGRKKSLVRPLLDTSEPDLPPLIEFPLSDNQSSL